MQKTPSSRGGKILNGISIADLMAEAGLTHGGFYKHFASKEALVEEACRYALAGSSRALETALAAAPPGAAVAALVEEYLSQQHRDRAETGCAIAAIGSEIARGDPATRKAMSEGFERIVGLLAAQMPSLPPAEGRERAVAAVATMIGALTTARAVAGKALSDEILAAARREVVRGRA